MWVAPESFMKIVLVLLLSLGFLVTGVARGDDNKTFQKSKLSSGENGLKKGGWGSSGGGSGVACFTSEATANEADPSIDNALPFPPELFKKITSVETLDYWEWAQTRPFEILIEHGNTADQILVRMQRVMQNVTPLVTFRLKQTAQLIDISKWQAKESLPRIYDVKPTAELPTNCRLVQLVTRYSSDNRKWMDGPSLNAPMIKAEYNAELFKKLTPLNQAVLRVHEQLYLLGQASGRNSSDVLRPLVMQFFKSYHVDRAVSRQLRTNVAKAIGDHPKFAANEYTVSGEIGTVESRFNSLNKILSLVKARSENCYKKHGITFPAKETPELVAVAMACKDKAFDMNELQNEFDEEMSFVFVAHYLLDHSEKQIEAEIFLAPNDDPGVQHSAKMMMGIACDMMDHIWDRYSKNLEPLFTKAGDYCVIPFPTGTNQN
jgi:hypothetical protein